MEELTRRQQQVLKFISDFTARNGFAPTVREIAQAMDIAIKGAQDHLSALERKGHIERKSKKPRTIQVLRAGIPVLGRIAAGRPTEAVENLEGSVSDLFPKGEIFALRVKGDSMTGDHIVDGDLAIIRKQPRVENGEIAAVSVDGEATLKRLYVRGDKAELRASNPAYRPILAAASDVTVLGKFVGIVRA